MKIPSRRVSGVIGALGTELIGYAASALVVVSLTMHSVVRLRVISLVGSVTFLVYAVLIGSIPIVLTNLAIVVINLWFLKREWSNDGFDLGVSAIRADSPFLLDFVKFHADDIARSQPDFVLPVGDDVVTLLLTREGLPAGALIGRQRGSTMMVDLDYVLSSYRDSRMGSWLFGHGSQVFRDLGINHLQAAASTDAHDGYLRRMGFKPLTGAQSGFALDL